MWTASPAPWLVSPSLSPLPALGQTSKGKRRGPDSLGPGTGDLWACRSVARLQLPSASMLNGWGQWELELPRCLTARSGSGGRTLHMLRDPLFRHTQGYFSPHTVPKLSSGALPSQFLNTGIYLFHKSYTLLDCKKTKQKHSSWFTKRVLMISMSSIYY